MIERLYPSFIIGGAPRSGTTFLCHALSKHPDIYIAEPYIPEPKIFFKGEKNKEEYLEDYSELFRNKPFNKPDSFILGEKTSNYLENEQALLRIHRTLPEVRMLFIVREPVARAYSNYLWSRKNGLENLSFEEAIELEGKRKSPFPPEREHVRPFDYMRRSDYATHVQRYYDLLGRDRVGIFLYEDIMLRPESLFYSIQTFIGAEPLPFVRLDPKRIINDVGKTATPINPVTEEKLRSFMLPYVQHFTDLTGLDISAWKY